MSQHLPGLPGPALEPATEGYWRAAGEGRLAIQRCEGCGQHRHPPTEVCYVCGSLAWGWDDQPGTGHVYTYTWADQPVVPALAELGAYNVSVVELDSTNGTVRILTRVVDVDRDQLRIGLPVEVTFDPVDEQIALPTFRPVTPEPARGA